jgi:hypothetical protein
VDEPALAGAGPLPLGQHIVASPRQHPARGLVEQAHERVGARVEHLARHAGPPVVARDDDERRRGLRAAEAARRAYRRSGADAVMIARGSLGWPWIFEELTGARTEPPGREEVAEELLWVIDQAEEHFGAERAARYLRKFYPWYLDRLGAPREISEELQRSADLPRARELIRLSSRAEVRPRPSEAQTVTR